MPQLEELLKHLQRGKVYRRSELALRFNAIDRHLAKLVDDGILQKLSRGVYYYPKESIFGNVPPEEKVLVRTFLKDDRFLLISPNAYNALGVVQLSSTIKQLYIIISGMASSNLETVHFIFRRSSIFQIRCPKNF